MDSNSQQRLASLWRDLGTVLHDERMEGNIQFVQWVRGQYPPLALKRGEKVISNFGHAGQPFVAQKSSLNGTAWRAPQSTQQPLCPHSEGMSQ